MNFTASGVLAAPLLRAVDTLSEFQDAILWKIPMLSRCRLHFLVRAPVARRAGDQMVATVLLRPAAVALLL
jgi:hypothetical protein